MNDQQLLEELSKVMRQVFNNQSVAVTPQTTPEDIEEWDSFNHVSLIAAVESHFGINFPTAKIDDMMSVGDLICIIRQTRFA